VESYLSNQSSHVFTHVAVLIFVFDISSKDKASDMMSFAETIRTLQEYTPSSKIFVLIHKMDLVPLQQKGEVFEMKSQEIRATCEEEDFLPDQVAFWPTSIWDQSLYRAWGQVIYFLIPNAVIIESMLGKLADLIDAQELVLYERRTCLVVTHVSRDTGKQNPLDDRLERLSQILKTHKHSMAKHSGTMASEVAFTEMQVKTNDFMFFITRLTENTNLAVVMANDEGAFNAARVNVQLARQEFSHLDIMEKKAKDVQRGLKEMSLVDDDARHAEDGEASSQGLSDDR
jgi:Ras-related GTP-binding protein A/B